MFAGRPLIQLFLLITVTVITFDLNMGGLTDPRLSAGIVKIIRSKYRARTRVIKRTPDILGSSKHKFYDRTCKNILNIFEDIKSKDRMLYIVGCIFKREGKFLFYKVVKRFISCPLLRLACYSLHVRRNCVRFYKARRYELSIKYVIKTSLAYKM